MSRIQRAALRAFKNAGLEVEIVEGRKHISVYHLGELVLTMSKGTKQTWRTEADIRRRIRRIKEGRVSLCDKRITRC